MKSHKDAQGADMEPVKAGDEVNSHADGQGMVMKPVKASAGVVVEEGGCYDYACESASIRSVTPSTYMNTGWP